MKEVTIKELVKNLQGKVIRVESADIYGVNLKFSKARIEYDEDVNELSFRSYGHIVGHFIPWSMGKTVL